MKKILLLLTLCIVSLFSMTTQAQSIIGSWTTDARELIGVDNDMCKKADCIFTFNQNGTAAMTWDLTMFMNEEEGMSMDMGIKVAMSGTYTKKGQEVTLDLDKDKTTVDLYKLELNLAPEMESALAAVGMTKAQMVEMIKNQIDPKEMMSDVEDLNGTFYIRTLTATQLVLGDDGVDADDDGERTLNFTRVVKKEGLWTN